MNSALVTAIITTYRRPSEVVIRAVKSVLAQTYKNIELIIVNDFPEDEKLHVIIRENLVSLNDVRIKYILHSKNQGACAARNTGILNSEGEYIAFLDDDDEWLPEKIQVMVSAIEKDKSLGLVYSSFYLNKRVITRGTKSGYIKNDMLCKNLISGTSMPLIRRKCFETCGMFDPNLLSSQDYDMWMRITIKYPVVYVDKPLTIRHFTEDSITTNIEKRKQGWDYFTEKYMELYKNNNYLYNYRLNAIVNASFMIGEFSYGIQKYRLALKVKPLSIQNVLCPMKGLIKFILYKKLKYRLL